MSDDQQQIDDLNVEIQRLAHRGSRLLLGFFIGVGVLAIGSWLVEKLIAPTGCLWAVTCLAIFAGVLLPIMVYGMILWCKAQKLGEEAYQLSLTPVEVEELERPQTAEEARLAWIKGAKLVAPISIGMLLAAVAFYWLLDGPRGWVMAGLVAGFALLSNVWLHFVAYRSWLEAKRRELDQMRDHDADDSGGNGTEI